MQCVLKTGLFEPVVIETHGGAIRLWIRKVTVNAGGALKVETEIAFEAPEEVQIGPEKGPKRAT